MTKLRLLTTSLFVSALILPVAAQSLSATPTPAPLATALTTPWIFTSNGPTPLPPNATASSLPPSYTVKASNDAPKPAEITIGKPFHISRDAEKYLKLHKGDALIAQNSTACFTLRSYNFTARDLKSANPTASSESDCTPASKVHLALVGPSAVPAPAIAK